jgi:hypothetical protein
MASLRPTDNFPKEVEEEKEIRLALETEPEIKLLNTVA